jgi:uncharacterized membrane protein YidH (DUF202 family)
MNIADLDGLLKDLEFTFGAPFVFFVLAMMNIRLTPRSRYSGLKLRLVLVVVIAFLVLGLGWTIFQDRDVLTTLLLTSPITYSCFYSVCILIVLAAIMGLIYWQLRPERWKNTDTARSARGEAVPEANADSLRE